MSLINEMLKDLETRGGQQETAAGLRAPVTAKAASSRRLVIALAGLVAALAIALSILLLSQPEGAAAVPASAQDRRADLPPPPETAAAQPVAVSVTSDQAASPAAVLAETAQAGTDAVKAASAPPTTVEVTASADEAGQTEQRDEPENEPGGETQTLDGRRPQEEAAIIVRRHEPTAEEKAQRASEEGFSALQRGNWLVASRLLSEVVAVDAANDDAREGLAVALTRQGRLAEADGVLVDGLAVANSPARFAKLRARLQASRGDLAAALDSLSISIPAVTADPEYHALKAALAQQAGRYEVAAESYRTLIGAEPANGKWHAGLGIALDGLGRPGEAQLAYRRAAQAGGLEAALAHHVRQRLSALDRQETE